MTREEARDEIKNLLDYIRGEKELKPIKTREDAEAEERKGVEALEMAIKVLEQEPKTGHWILTIEDWNKWTCSECGFSKRTDVHVRLGYNYCPKCGAKMESEVLDADSN